MRGVTCQAADRVWNLAEKIMPMDGSEPAKTIEMRIVGLGLGGRLAKHAASLSKDAANARFNGFSLIEPSGAAH